MVNVDSFAGHGYCFGHRTGRGLVAPTMPHHQNGGGAKGGLLVTTDRYVAYAAVVLALPPPPPLHLQFVNNPMPLSAMHTMESA